MDNVEFKVETDTRVSNMQADIHDCPYSDVVGHAVELRDIFITEYKKTPDLIFMGWKLYLCFLIKAQQHMHFMSSTSDEEFVYYDTFMGARIVIVQDPYYCTWSFHATVSSLFLCVDRAYRAAPEGTEIV